MGRKHPQPSLTRTLTALAGHARMRPDAAAILDNSISISYQTLWQDICRTISMLEPIVPEPEALAAVEWTSPYRHVVLLLALEHFGVVTATYRAQEIGDEYQRLFSHSDLIAAATIRPHRTCLTILCDDLWWEKTLSKPVNTVALRDSKPAKNHRIACSSGTTGAPKFMMRTSAQSEFRFSQNQKRLVLTQNSRLVLPATFAFQANYLSFISCMRVGGLCIFAGDAPLFQTLKEQSATHSIVIPMEFIALKSMDHRNALPPGLKILIVGGSLTPADRAAWREVCPTGTLIELYGTNESGTIAEIQSDTRGKIIPELEVQVVDDNDIPLPYGKEGTIRLRGEPCATHYLFEEHPRPERFREGWFYPGDKAILEDASHLQLLGRDDDLLNVRGYKIPAAAIEEIVKGFPEVIDCCATTIQDPLDDGAIWLGVRFSPNADFSDIQQKLKSHLPIKADIHLYTVDTIPRGPSGKIQRHTVATRLRHHIRSAAQKKTQSMI
ncbi:class I adenylate-forming enzyme family protein [Hwanghaeella sp. 1Z406]|jgi:acyl-coenzyme A synthetase/AMP-(fatty) acid ligase|uniref:class I adenylate-forming enzyme family protein n=1 Tax=Hwanghaeella sp. 1Z406 TaxID=3402811 RepID=UPI003B680639|tara:strand:+ start:40556 stop:42043 length:1488 start_codon:yes stop_codon:yes gene_type:complete